MEYYADLNGITVKRAILYKKEDVRKDACIVRLVKELAKLVKCDYVASYNVLPISVNSGVIEIVPECSTLSHIYRNGSLSNFLQKYNPNQTVKNIQMVYQNSLAFWTIITYILGIKDRHFDNIMVTFSGKLFHIDFDFIFGKDSKLYSPKIRLNSYMIEGLGGDDKYREFKEICEQYFMQIRQNIDMVYALLMNLVVASPGLGVTDEYLKEHLIRSFFIGEADDVVKGRLEFIIDECKDSFVGGINDYIHTAAKSTSGIFSLFS
jgi:phosphatidylinositol 3-kinase